MSSINPIWAEGQRKLWLRPDWRAWAKPDAHHLVEPPEQKRAARFMSRQAAAEQAAAEAEREAFERELLHLRWLVKSMRLELALRRFQEKYNPDQPRVPAGSADGGQWTSGVGGQASRDDTRVLSDATPENDWKPGAQYATNTNNGSLGTADHSPSKVQLAAMSWDERRRMLFGQRDFFGGGGGAGAPTLPMFRSPGPTAGVLQSLGRADIPLISGKGGPASSMPWGSSGFDYVTRTHVEGHAATLMRQLGISRGTLYINNPQICPSCDRLLPRMLPPGATLNVVPSTGVVHTFVGAVP